MWETVADIVVKKGAQLHMESSVVGLVANSKNGIAAVKIKDNKTGKIKQVSGDYFFSTMPIKELIPAVEGVKVPDNVLEVADGLMYRDFMTVGLLLKKMKIKNHTNRKTIGDVVPDNWIYIQERDVKVGRLQIFNNWSPYMVKDPKTVWLGMEYFVNEGDALWNMRDKDFIEFAIDELDKIDIIKKEDVLDGTLIRVKKTYPAYFGAYERFDEVRRWVSEFENLFLIGRNGMHRYNNQDHSMLTAMVAVENIIGGVVDKQNIWEVNTEMEYHEEKQN